MQQDLHERIQNIISASDVRAQSALPVAFIERLNQFDPNIDQVHLFAKWEALEVREIAIRYSANGGSHWLSELGSSDASTAEADPWDEEPGCDDELPPFQDSGSLSVRSWLEEITTNDAPYSPSSPSFYAWALASRERHCVSRWNAAQVLERARAWECYGASELQREQHDLEEQIVSQNFRAALFWAYRLRGDLPLPLALAAGLAGVRRAAKAFDPGRGNKFLTLGYHWIRQAISRMRADHALPIRIPAHRMQRQSRMKRALSGLSVGSAQDLSPKEILHLVNSFEGQKWTLSEAEQCVAFDRKPRLSDVDSPLDLVPAMDAYFDEFRPSPIELPLSPDTLGLRAEELDALVEYIDNTFTGPKDLRTKEVVIQRLQLHGRRERLTLEELGGRFGVTRERIRQVQSKAFLRIASAMKWATE